MTEEQINKLIEQLETAKAAVIELQEIMDACEAANAKHLARIDHLEGAYWRMWGENEKLRELCRYMYMNAEHLEPVYNFTTGKEEYPYTERMEQLGLINETEYDPDTGLKWGEQA